MTCTHKEEMSGDESVVQACKGYTAEETCEADFNCVWFVDCSLELQNNLSIYFE